MTLDGVIQCEITGEDLGFDKRAFIKCYYYLEKCANNEWIQRAHEDAKKIRDYVKEYIEKKEENVKVKIGRMINETKDKESKDYYKEVMGAVAEQMVLNMGLSSVEEVNKFLEEESRKSREV